VQAVIELQFHTKDRRFEISGRESFEINDFDEMFDAAKLHEVVMESSLLTVSKGRVQVCLQYQTHEEATPVTIETSILLVHRRVKKYFLLQLTVPIHAAMAEARRVFESLNLEPLLSDVTLTHDHSLVLSSHA
jgi:hypothetical protein